MSAVLVIGAGPVGLMATAELLRRGVPVTCVDRAAAPSPLSKALLVWPRTMEVLRDHDHGGIVVSEGLPVESFRYYSSARLVARLRFNSATRPVVLPQPDVVRLLLGAVQRLGGTVGWGCGVEDLAQDAAGVRAVVTGSAGRSRELRSGYGLGCDGAGSTVRERLGVAFEGSTYEHTFMLADVRVDGPLQHDAVHYFCSAQGVLVLIGLPGGRYRVFTSGTPGMHAEDVDLPLLQHMVDARGPGGLRLYDDVWTSTFSVHARRAARYRVGRVFLAGDAAHIHSPAGGQGMNTGILDAHALAWRLAMVHHGHAAPPLLDGYEPERAQVARGVVQQSDRQTRAWLLTRRSHVAARDAGARLASASRLLDRVYAPQLTGNRTTYAPAGLDPRLERRRGALRCGALVPDAPIGTTTGAIGLRRLLSPGRYTLLVWSRQAAVSVELAAVALRCAAHHGGLETRFLIGDRLLDPARATAARRRNPLTAAALVVLVRPDGHVDAIADADDLHLLVKRVSALLRPATAVDTRNRGIGDPMHQPRFTYDDVRGLLVEHMDVDPADLPDGADATFDELGLDSLANAELQVVMQQQHGIEMADDHAHAVETVLELLACMNLHAALTEAGA